MMKRFILPVLIAGLLTACTTFGTDYKGDLEIAKNLRTSFCAANPSSSFCTADADAKAKVAYTAALKAIAAYNKSQTDVNLKAVEKAVAAAIALYEAFMN